MSDFFSKERITANVNFNRWLVPPAALAIHLSIGMAYGFSVFWLPLSKALGIKEPVACAETMSIWARAFATDCDWKVSDLGWMYTLFFVFLGSSAAVFGHWLETAGPRKAGSVAALCWGGGLIISAYGVYTHQLWLMWLGSGVIGGIGLGLGYISPVSSLIKWFPDRRGMATGMAIMGFGGGAMIGAPLANTLMSYYATPTSVGVWQTFVIMGVIYFTSMMIGALCYRVPPTGWAPAGWVPPAATSNAMITHRHVHVNHAHKLQQFWLLWAVLCLNVSAGIGVIGMASPMLQEVFGGMLIGEHLKLAELSSSQLLRVTAIGAGFAGILSFSNIIGRIGWASASDLLGRKRTYSIFFALGLLLYVSAPWAGTVGSVALFAGIFCIILTMYGGAFSTIPAYLADIFGTQHVGAIHGRLLTAWATAGVLGPVTVNYLRDYQLDHGVPASEAYNVIMYVLAGLLVLGFICNLFVTPIAEKHYMTDTELEKERKLAHEKSIESTIKAGENAHTKNHPLLVVVAWSLVAIPISYGIWSTLQQAWILFH